jgi:hypothetical protein
MASRALTVEVYVRRPSLNPESEQVDAIVFECGTAQRGWRLARILHKNSGLDGLDEALGHVESGETDGLVVIRLADLGPTCPKPSLSLSRPPSRSPAAFAFASRLRVRRSDERQRAEDAEPRCL